MIESLEKKIDATKGENIQLQEVLSQHHNIIPHADRLEEKCLELSELNDQLVNKNAELLKELEIWRTKHTTLDAHFKEKMLEINTLVNQLKCLECEFNALKCANADLVAQLNDCVGKNG